MAYLLTHIFSSVLRAVLVDSHYIDKTKGGQGSVLFTSLVAATVVGGLFGLVALARKLEGAELVIWPAISLATVAIILVRAILIFEKRIKALLLAEALAALMYLTVFATPTFGRDPLHYVVIWFMLLAFVTVIALRHFGIDPRLKLKFGLVQKSLATETVLNTIGKQLGILGATVLIASQVVVVHRLAISFLGLANIGVQTTGQSGLATLLRLRNPHSQRRQLIRLASINGGLFLVNILAILLLFPMLSKWLPILESISSTSLWLALLSQAPSAINSVLSAALKSSGRSHLLLRVNILDFVGQIFNLGLGIMFASANLYFVGATIVGIVAGFEAFRLLNRDETGS